MKDDGWPKRDRHGQFARNWVRPSFIWGCLLTLPLLFGWVPFAYAGCSWKGVWHKFLVCDPPSGTGGGGGPTYRTPTPQERAAEERRKGEDFLRHPDYLKAIRHFRNALKHTPGDRHLESLLSRALLLRGKEAASFGNFDETISLVAEALRYTPGDQALIRVLRDAYLGKLDRYYSVKYYSEAIEEANSAMRRHKELRNDPALLKAIKKSQDQIHKIEMEKFRREEAVREAREGHARAEIGDLLDRGIISRVERNAPGTEGRALKQLFRANDQGKAAVADTSPWGEGAKGSSNDPFDLGPPVRADGQNSSDGKIPPIGNAGPVELAKIDRYLDKNINSLDQQIRGARNPEQKSKLLEQQVQMLEQQAKVLEQSIRKEKDPLKRGELINKQTHARSKKQVREIELMDLSVRGPKR